MRRVALLVGNQIFESDSGLTDLRYPAEDVKLLEKLFSDPKLGGFDRVIPLIDASSQEIMHQLNTLFEQEKGSSVLFFYSGHGKPADNGKLYLAARDTKENLLLATGVKFSSIIDFKDAYGTSRLSIILDCCFAGLGSPDVKGSGDDRLKSFSEGSGVFFIGAANATTLAKEDGQLGHGVLTAAIAQGIQSGDADLDRDGRITGANLYDWCCSFAAEREYHQPVQVNIVKGNELIIAFAEAPMTEEVRTQILNELQLSLRKGMIKGSEFDDLKSHFQKDCPMPMPGTLAAAFAAYVNYSISWEEFVQMRAGAVHETGRVSDTIERTIRRLPTDMPSKIETQVILQEIFISLIFIISPTVFLILISSVVTPFSGDISYYIIISFDVIISFCLAYVLSIPKTHRIGAISAFIFLYVLGYAFIRGINVDYFLKSSIFLVVSTVSILSGFLGYVSTLQKTKKIISRIIDITK